MTSQSVVPFMIVVDGLFKDETFQMTIDSGGAWALSDNSTPIYIKGGSLVTFNSLQLTTSQITFTAAIFVAPILDLVVTPNGKTFTGKCTSLNLSSTSNITVLITALDQWQKLTLTQESPTANWSIDNH
jgi:hypothetical protein